MGGICKELELTNEGVYFGDTHRAYSLFAEINVIVSAKLMVIFFKKIGVALADIMEKNVYDLKVEMV